MRLAVVGPTYPIKGGISHYTTLLVRALRKSNDVWFFSYKYQYPSILYPGTGQYTTDESPFTEDAEFLWHTLQPWTLNTIAKRMEKEKVEGVILTWVTHFFGWHIKHLADQIHQRIGCPVILLCHNVKQHEDRPMERPLTRMAFNAVDGFIVHSQEDFENLRKFLPGANIRKNFHPTYDIFADTSRWTRETARNQLGLADEPMVLYFGAVRPYKGLRWLIDAAPAICSTVGKCQVWCVGDFWDGPEMFEDQAKRLGILYNPENPSHGGVRIVSGYIPNEQVGMYFAACDLLVLPYESATQSGIVQIAYGFNKPCIVTDVGGLPEVVLDGKTGFVVPPKNAGALASKTAEFFSAGTQAGSKMEAEIREWRKVFDWEHMVETITSQIKELK